MTPGHHITKCSKCQKIIEQCRCMDPGKTIYWVICDDCKKKENRKTGQDDVRRLTK